MPDPERYLLLASMQEATWGSTKMRYVFESERPEADLVGNVRCTCFVGDQVLVIDTEEFGLTAFPGGVLEPGEGWVDRRAQARAPRRNWRPASGGRGSGPPPLLVRVRCSVSLPPATS